jgi:ABC-type transport system involved in cytochrome c biogenesis ATPase subunit
MKLVEIRVRNFRSIETEQHFPIPGRMTLVGPNNSGKTNLLRAVRVLFTGYDNSYGYTRNIDLTFSAGKARTSITATFDGNALSDKAIYDSIDELHGLQGTTRSGTLITLNLYFTDTNTPVYSFFPNVKRPPSGAQAAQYSRTHISLVNTVLKSFSLHYVPSVKGVSEIYNELLTPFLRRKIAKVMEPHMGEVDASLAEAAKALNDELAAAGLPGFQTSFSLPNESVEDLVAGFDFMIADPQKTPIHEKGMGIQTTALLAAFRWITKQENDAGRSVIWLLEEPESYLHPHLANSCNKLLDNLAIDSTVITTTHSMAFVPQDPTHVCGTLLNKENRTEVTKFVNFQEAVSSIRGALGIKFGDFYNLALYNVFVEGKSDREIFQWVLTKFPIDEYAWPNLRQAQFEDFGGVTHLCGFLRATYQFISKERACVAVFDGDDAGDKVRRELQGFFGNKNIPFEANKHYVSVRSKFSIEGLFPDQWIVDLHEQHAGWFDSYSTDAADQLEPFSIKDNKKSDVQISLIARADADENLEWSTRFRTVFTVLDTALGELHQKLISSN